MFTSPALDLIDTPGGAGIGPGSFGRWRSRVRDLPEFAGELPVAALAEEMTTEGQGQIRALVTHAGNPVLSTPTGQALDAALASLDFMVAIDFYINETTRHANVILPPPSPLARPHYDLVFHHLAIRNTAKYSPPLFPSSGGLAEPTLAIELVRRLVKLRGRYGLGERVRLAALERLGVEGMLDIGLRTGKYGLPRGPLAGGLSSLRAAPHGVDLGPLNPCMPRRMRRWRQKIDMAPSGFLTDLQRLFGSAAEGEPKDPRELRLIGRRHPRSNNSWMHNVPKLMAGKPICTLLVNPVDAERLGLSNGALARVTSSAGQIEVKVEIDPGVMVGVVSLPHGFGHNKAGTRLAIANQHAGASINDLTSAAALDMLTGNAVLSDIPVVVAPAS